MIYTTLSPVVSAIFRGEVDADLVKAIPEALQFHLKAP